MDSGHLSMGHQLMSAADSPASPRRSPCIMHEAFINTPLEVHLLLMLSLRALRGSSPRPLLPSQQRFLGWDGAEGRIRGIPNPRDGHEPLEPRPAASWAQTSSLRSTSENTSVLGAFGAGDQGEVLRDRIRTKPRIKPGTKVLEDSARTRTGTKPGCLGSGSGPSQGARKLD